MKKLIILIIAIIVIILIIAGVYYFVQTYYKDSEVANFLQNITDTLTQTTSESVLDLAINTDLTSDIAAIATAENGEGLVAYTKIQNNTEILDKIVIMNKDGEAGLIELNNNGLPESFSFLDYEITYNNYTASTVDIILTKPDGSTESITGSPLNLPETGQIISFIKSANATEPLETELPEQGTSRKQYLESNGDDASFLDYITSSIGTTMNIITCGISIPAIIGTAGASTPFSYLACGALIVRLTTHYTEAGSCKGDIIDCATNAILDSLRNKGPVIAGTITDIMTQDPISNAVLQIRDKNGRLKGRAFTNDYGHYRLPLLDVGGYSIVVSAENYDSKTYLLATTNTNILISDEEGEKPINQTYDLNDRKYFKKIRNYYGPELSQPYNVRFDIVLGDAGKFDGEWTGRAETEVKFVPDPDDPNEFIECGGADFGWTIEGGNIEGYANTDMGYPLTLEGTVNESGVLEAGMAYGSENIANFEGNLEEDNGRGRWSDPYGCKGVFTVEKNQPEIVPEGHAAPLM